MGRTIRTCRTALAAGAALLAASAADADTGGLAAYARARVAAADGAVDEAVRDYAQALAARPDDAALARHAYEEAVRAGDVALIDRAVAALGPAAPPEAALLGVAAAAHARDGATADAAIAQLRRGRLRVLAAPLAAWRAFERGEDALAPLAATGADRVARRFADEARALILIAQGHGDEGVAALRPLLGNDHAGDALRIAAARLLVAQPSPDAARALLVGDAPELVAFRTRLPAAATPGLAFGAATLFIRVASDLALGPPAPLSFALAQAALRADPAQDGARLLLADALQKDGATDRALAVLGGVDPRGGYATAAASARVRLLAAAGRTQDALAAAAPDAADPAALERLAALYLQLGRAADAVPLYARLVALAGAGAGAAEWLQYGAALDEAGDWNRARVALDKAAALAPDDPLVLNYLGYALVSHDERMAEGQRLLERAARLRPDDPSIADSLGWALFRRGEIARALPLIERAAAAEPANAEIAEHLGDVYWRASRRYEARYAWTAARQLGGVRDGARLTAKIADGL